MAISDDESYDAKEQPSPHSSRFNRSSTETRRKRPSSTEISMESENEKYYELAGSTSRQSMDPVSVHTQRRSSYQRQQEQRQTQIRIPKVHFTDHTIKRNRSSVRLLASLKIQRSRQMPRSDQSFECSEEDDLSIASSSSSTSLDHMDSRRHSLESSYSSLLSHFSSSTFMHSHPPPPHGARYVKVKSKARHIHKEPTKIVHAQTLQGRPTQIVGAIWTMRFSKDGMFLAAGGQDHIVRVWKVLGSDSSVENQQQQHTIHVFESKPVCEFHGHTGDILDLCWSKSHFLLSSSMDTFVRLWHVSKQECLCAFQHTDFIPSIAFHPMDDRLFLSGSADGKVRLWNIPDKSVVSWNQLPERSIVTAVNFTGNGKTACIGTYDGHLYFYEPKNMELKSQMTVHSDKAKKGEKVTSIEWMPSDVSSSDDDKILVTSNDSRIRLFNVADQSLVYKYKGAVNSSRQIKATFSDDGLFIICGSDKSYVHVWNTKSNQAGSSHLQDQLVRSSAFPNPTENETEKKNKHKWWRHKERRSEKNLDKHHHERHFEAHRDAVTCAVFAPTRTRSVIAETGRDIIFNHTPKPRSPAGQRSEEELQRHGSAPSTFITGQIMVSSDEHGGIKVWRMDSGVYTAPRKSSAASSASAR